MILRTWRILESYKGECYPIWINQNQVDNRLDGGVSGFFRQVKRWHGIPYCVGEEFHGIQKWGESKISPTELKESKIADDVRRYIKERK